MKINELPIIGVGTYAKILLNPDDSKKIYQHFQQWDIPNQILPEEYHLTLLHSRKFLPNYIPIYNYEPTITGNPKKIALLGPPDSPTKALVVLIDSEAIVDRHRELHKQFDIHWTFDRYIPHVTIAYGLPNTFDISTITKPNGSIQFIGERKMLLSA